MVAEFLKIYVPIVLAVMMFGMGMQLVVKDWSRLLRSPRAVLTGLLSQLLVLPAMAFLMVFVLELPLVIAAGIVILAACPGGIASNSVSLLVRADVPLSVTLTAVSSLLALVSVPLVISIGLDIARLTAVEAGRAASIRLPLADTLGQIFLVMVLPLAAGMITRKYARRLAQKSEQWLRLSNVALLLILLLGALIVGFDFLVKNIVVLGPVLLTLNLGCMLGGYVLAQLFVLPREQRLTIAIETGFQNVGLGMMVALNLLRQPDWIVVPSVYAIVMMLTSLAMVIALRNRNQNAVGEG